MSDYGPSIKAARLFERVSAKGNVYYSGRMGNVRVSLLKSNETADDRAAIWNLMFAEMPAKSSSEGERPATPSKTTTAAARDWQRPPETATARRKPKDDEPIGTKPNEHDIIPF